MFLGLGEGLGGMLAIFTCKKEKLSSEKIHPFQFTFYTSFFRANSLKKVLLQRRQTTDGNVVRQFICNGALATVNLAAIQ
jgi:hypothetical protein